MTGEASLAWVLHPLSVETFLGEIWATTHHRVERRSVGYFDGLFTATVAEEIMEFRHPDQEAVRLVRADETKAPASYRFSGGAIDLVRVRNAFADGFTIVLNGLERYAPAIAALVRAIEDETNFETQVNAYITPPESQGFLPHYDDHDVLILQIQGSKTWYLYDEYVPPHQLPRRDAFVGSDLPRPKGLCLDAGDVLYIPRGQVHAAEANADASIHLTVGIHAPTVLSLVTRTLDALSVRDDSLLARLPPRHLDDPEVRARLHTLVCEAVSTIEDPSLVADAVGSVEDALVRRGRCRPVGKLVSDVVAAERIGATTLLVKCGSFYSRVLAMNGHVALQFAQSLVSASADHRAAMLFVSRSDKPFRVSDLPGLSPAQQVELARKLLIDGFLTQAGR